ncbi:MAG: DUF1992 domain-containing protein [Desulfobacteraceae bacterium]|jgi:hypothetical protein
MPLIPGFDEIIERRIREAQQNGDFDNLPGRGRPLELEDDSGIPEDLRLVYKILKNANCLPPEVELRKEIHQMKDLLEAIPDEKEKYLQIRRINYKVMKLNTMGRGSAMFEEKEIYYKKLVDRLGRK